jgi:hypothetical protein
VDWQQSGRIWLERWPEHRGDELKFRLLYEGELPSEQRSSASIKQRIRRHLHPQLRTLWHNHPLLAQFTQPNNLGVVQVNQIADNYASHEFRWVPLVRRTNMMACRLDMLLLLRQEPYRIFPGGERSDLDNRIKTLIDGLRMPRQKTELGGAVPEDGEDPFYCLLEDDSAIYDFSVSTDRLLSTRRADEPERDVVAMINVHVTLIEGHEIAVRSYGFGPLIWEEK